MRIRSTKTTQPLKWLTVFTLFVLALAACSPATSPDAPSAASPAPGTAAATEPAAATAEDAVTEEAVTEEDVTEEATIEEVIAAPVTATAGILLEGATAEGTATAEVTPAPSIAEGCPTATEDQAVVINADDGYCFLIPAGCTTDHNLVVYAPETTEGHRERATIEVTPAEGRTAAKIADALLAELPGFEVERSTTQLDHVTAEVLDGMPGQDLNRRVIAVANDRAYSLMFMPLAPEENPEAYAQMEELYTLMINSFHFLTPVVSGPQVPASDPILTWQGEIDGACHELRVWAEGIAQAGVCGDAPSATTQLLSPAVEWEAVQAHFGNIEAETPHGTITFAGSGTATSDTWANALATWAEFAAMESISGRPSATGRTRLAWQMDEIGDHPGQCPQLIVLVYGYAYANQIPCEGNEPGVLLAQAWLTDEEMETFTTWLNEHTRVDDQAGYLDATGDAPLTVEEIDAFAAGVYDRIEAGAAAN
jgi:hypothetical protein